MKLLRFSLLVVSLTASSLALDNGFGRTPILGYNSYNDVACSPNETQITATINALSSKGLTALGFNYFQIDCGWQGYQRLSNGSITYDKTPFPNGIKPLSDLARSKGMKWSMYTCQGVYSCDTSYNPHRPGSLGYEKQDAAMFAAWNTEYVKVDNCFVDPNQNAPKDARTDFPARYGNMSTALANVGIKGMLVCQWGVPYQSPSSGLEGPAQWTPALSTSFRVSDDIATGWANVLRITNEAIHVNLKNSSGPGHFADMDLLEVGNPGMTYTEQATHFAIWGVFKSALMISTNVPNMSSATMSILQNKDIIAINQDSLGVPVKLVQRYTDDSDVYFGPLANGDRVVFLFDQSNKARTLSIDFATLGISSATARDLWSGQTVSGASSFSKSVGARDVLLLRLSKIVYSNAAAPTRTYYQASAGSLSGNANVQTCSGCSNGHKAGNLDGSSSVTISNIKATQASQDVLFDYINCEIGYLGGSNNERRALVSVNGGAAQTISFPITGYNWDSDLIKSYRVRLSGFSTTGANTITVKGPSSGYAPDLDRIAII